MKSLVIIIGIGITLFFVNPLTKQSMKEVKPKNVLGTELQTCCNAPMTGFYRDGFCSTGYEDYGVHVVCAEVTQDFLDYTKSRGNDLSTPLPPPSSFPGLKPGDKWCLCASRWKEAYNEGSAPKVVLEATHKKALEFMSIEVLNDYAAE